MCRRVKHRSEGYCSAPTEEAIAVIASIADMREHDMQASASEFRPIQSARKSGFARAHLERMKAHMNDPFW